MKPYTPAQAIDALIGNEEQNRKQKEEQKKETGSGPPTQPYIYIIIIDIVKGVTLAGSTQRYYITGGLGEEERQENMEK